MPKAHDPEAGLVGKAALQTLSRLKLLGLVDDDAEAALARLTGLISHAVENGEQNEENLVLYAMGRFPKQK